MYKDRREAGLLLAEALQKLDLADPVVLALPRGGIPVGAAISERLEAPLDMVLVRKLGAPGNEELAVGAIVDGEPPDLVVNRDITEALGLHDDDLYQLAQKERPEMERRRALYLGERSPLCVENKTAILVDDGAATGASMKAAVQALKRRSPARIVVALPVAPADTVRELAELADLVVCLLQPEDFDALSRHYGDFRQYDDQEVLDMLEAARTGIDGARPPQQ